MNFQDIIFGGKNEICQYLFYKMYSYNNSGLEKNFRN